MNIKQLDEALYDKYIAPTDRPVTANVGIEIELPVVDLSGKAVNERIVIEAAERIREHFSFTADGIDDNGSVNSMTNRKTGDNLSFDCSYSNLELSLGKSDDLNRHTGISANRVAIPTQRGCFCRS